MSGTPDIDMTFEVMGAGNHRFRRPFIAKLTSTKDGALASIDELDLWMDGDDATEALRDLTASLASLIDDLLASPDPTLGPDPLRWKRILTDALE